MKKSSPGSTQLPTSRHLLSPSQPLIVTSVTSNKIASRCGAPRPPMTDVGTETAFCLYQRKHFRKSKHLLGSEVTMIHSGTLCIQRKVTKFPFLGALSSELNFKTFSQLFGALFFAMQLALVSMITITPTLSLSVFSLQRTRLFPTCGELWRTCGELWLYFELQRRLDLWSFSWSSRRSREAQK